jgi:hypothetical protein
MEQDIGLPLYVPGCHTQCCLGVRRARVAEARTQYYFCSNLDSGTMKGKLRAKEYRKVTPAVAAGLTDRRWFVMELISYPLA